MHNSVTSHAVGSRLPELFVIEIENMVQLLERILRCVCYVWCSRSQTVVQTVVLRHTALKSSTEFSSKTWTANQGGMDSIYRRHRQQVHTSSTANPYGIGKIHSVSTADQMLSIARQGSIKSTGGEVTLSHNNLTTYRSAQFVSGRFSVV